jgi:Fe-S-cluster containining protein
MSGERASPCLRCGACCAQYRVSFYWSEADDATPGGVPVALTERVDAHRCAMRGTQTDQPRCIALEGRVGQDVRCRIYAQRPSPCHEFEASWASGQAQARCDAAREYLSLPPLTPADWR